MFVVVAIKKICHVQQVHVRCCHFSVMFKYFGHIDLVMLTTLLIFHFQQFLKQRNYEAKFNIDLVEDPNTGKTTFVDRPKDEVNPTNPFFNKKNIV